MDGRHCGQHGRGLRTADHDHALGLPELDPVHHAGRHRELHAPAPLVPGLLHNPRRVPAPLIPKLRRELVDRGNRRRRRDVPRERSEIHLQLISATAIGRCVNGVGPMPKEVGGGDPSRE